MINLSKIIAVVLVLIAIALGIYAWMLGRKPAVAVPTASSSASAAPKAETFPVVFTTKAVQAGQPIPADSLQIQQLPVNPPNAIREIQAATGRIPVFDMAPNTPLLENQLSSGL
ncbi:MAG: SAF domain-containing protein, partial [Pseudomonadota bacterium]